MSKKQIFSSDLVWLAVVASIILLLLSAGCGHRGPLRLPDSDVLFMEVRIERF